MKKILLLSDTHGHLDERILVYCSEADEIWHAGDVGNFSVIETLENIKPLKGVYGNIDGEKVRKVFPKANRFKCEEVDVMMTHIAGRPEKYIPEVKTVMETDPPKILICGHSHILLVKFEKKYNCLHLNPGAAGIAGFHKVRTMLRFVIDRQEIRDLEAIELGKR